MPSSEADTWKFFDLEYPLNEQIPRRFEARFEDDGTTLSLFFNNSRVGDRLTDRARQPDGYRFHDAFHLSNAAVLGWSPVLRSMLSCRRGSNPLVNDVEDGGRAQMIEEAICHVIYDHGQDHDLATVDVVDEAFVSYVKRLARGLEVAEISNRLWAKAISDGYTAFDLLRRFGGGRLCADLANREIKFSR